MNEILIDLGLSEGETVKGVVVDTVNSAETNIIDTTNLKHQEILLAIETTCAVRRRLSEKRKAMAEEERQQKINEILQKTNTRKNAAKKGLSHKDTNSVLSKLLNGLSTTFHRGVEATMKQPGSLDELDMLMEAEIDANGDSYSRQLATSLIDSAIDPVTGKLDTEKLKNMQSVFENIDEMLQRDLQISGDPNATCLALLDETKPYLTVSLSITWVTQKVTNSDMNQKSYNSRKVIQE